MKNSQDKNLKSLAKSGDIFELGDHRLICGDSRDKKIIAKLFGDKKARSIITDPPYGVAYVESKAGFKQNLACENAIENDQEQSEEEYRQFTKNWLSISIPYLLDKNSAYIFNADKMLFALRDGMLDSSFKFSQLLIWMKSQAVVGRLDYLPQHELIAYGWHGKHLFRKSKDKSLLFAPKPNRSKLHPTMKPASLIRQLILNSTELGDIVFDPFGGSGTTLIASEMTKRRCYMVEFDPSYCQSIIKRFESLTKTKAKRL